MSFRRHIAARVCHREGWPTGIRSELRASTPAMCILPRCPRRSLLFTRHGGAELKAFTDTHGGQITDQRSTLGFFSFLKAFL